VKKSNETRKKIELALLKFQKGRMSRKFSIAAIAEEAGVSPSTLHNRYPDIVKKIRAKMNKENDHRTNKRQLELEKNKIIIKRLRNTIIQLNLEIKQLASENMRLLIEKNFPQTDKPQQAT
jgi:hypothetical protein